MENYAIEISDGKQTLIEFINKTKEGRFSEKDSILQEYVLRYETPEDIDFLNEFETVEQYHFGLTD